MNLRRKACLEDCPFIAIETDRQKNLAAHIAQSQQRRELVDSFSNILDDLSQDLGTIVIKSLDKAGLDDEALIKAQAQREVTERLEAIESATFAKEVHDDVDAEIAQLEAEIEESEFAQAALLARCHRGPKIYKAANSTVCRSKFKAEGYLPA